MSEKLTYKVHTKKIINNNVLLNIEFGKENLTPETAYVSLIGWLDDECSKAGKDIISIIQLLRQIKEDK